MTRDDIDRLVDAARAVRPNAYAPYSRFYVGAALLGESGAVHLGVNVENAAYPVGLCAERCALGAATVAREPGILAVAIVGGASIATPCGMCRQALMELAPDALVVLATEDPQGPRREMTVRDLLPNAFGPEDLAQGK